MAGESGGKGTEIRLSEDEAALVIRAAGEMAEFYVPNGDDVSEVPDWVKFVSACAMGYNDPEFMKFVGSYLDKRLSSSTDAGKRQ